MFNIFRRRTVDSILAPHKGVIEALRNHASDKFAEHAAHLDMAEYHDTKADEAYDEGTRAARLARKHEELLTDRPVETPVEKPIDPVQAFIEPAHAPSL